MDRAKHLFLSIPDIQILDAHSRLGFRQGRGHLVDGVFTDVAPLSGTNESTRSAALPPVPCCPSLYGRLLVVTAVVSSAVM